MRKLTLFLSFFIVVSLCSAYAVETGNATYYSKRLKGRHTSDGGKYHPDSLTCAHHSRALGSYIKVTNMNNDKEVVVKVTDRCARSRRLIIDLSYRAALELDLVRTGSAKVKIVSYDSTLTMPTLSRKDSVLTIINNQ